MTLNQIFYQVAIDVPLRCLFDYLPPDNSPFPIQRGMRVKVPFGKHERFGIILKVNHISAIDLSKLKPISGLCEDFALFPESLCDFIEKTAQYYHHPIGEVAFTGTPSGISKGKKVSALTEGAIKTNPQECLTLNDSQQTALDAILLKKGSFQPFLVEGITGSGKTEIYLQAAASLLLEKKQILILVPEISLTPQTQARFKARFGDDVICYHSKMTPSQRLLAWLKVRFQNASIVIGTRSAVFLPFVNLGLLVIDEEHDPSFKQQEGFRYSARDLGVLRAKLDQCPVLLGSATPSFESIFNVKIGKYQKLYLPNRATNAKLPQMHLLDVRHNQLEAGLSPFLLNEIEKSLIQGQQILLFINRRGYAPTYLCYDCGWLAQCDFCDSRLTYHHKKQILVCHHCLRKQKKPTKCPSCGHQELNPVGQGTEKLETFLQNHFPNISIARIDSDTSKNKTLDVLLAKAQNKEAQILIGTQILAKGHHFPHLSMVAIVDADGGLFSVDFRSIERMSQLLIQVAGRAGRVHEAGRVFIQTFHPEHPLIQSILHQDYPKLAEKLLLERQQYTLPPFAHFALIRCQGSKQNEPENLLHQLQTEIIKHQNKAVSILGPVPAPMLKRQGLFRYQLLIQANDRKSLHEMLSYSVALLEKSKLAKKLRWSLDVDPIEMF